MIFKAVDVTEIPAELKQYEQYEQYSRDIHLEIPEQTYPLTSETIPYTIVNELGVDVPITLIPKFERKEGGEWVEVPFADVGFCGTPDTIRELYNGEVLLNWWGDNLTAGSYQLSYKLHDSDIVIWERFELE